MKVPRGANRVQMKALSSPVTLVAGATRGAGPRHRTDARRIQSRLDNDADAEIGRLDLSALSVWPWAQVSIRPGSLHSPLMSP